MQTRRVPIIVALSLALVAGAVQAQDKPAGQEGAGAKLGSWFKQLGKGIDDAVQGAAQGGNAAGGAVNQAAAAVNGSVRGRVALQGGKTATCFNGIAACYLGAANMTNPGQAQGVPAMLILPDGRAVPNNADQLAHFGVLVLPAAPVAGNGDTGYRDPYGCTDPSWTKDEIVRRRREIMQCQSDAITERAGQRAQARQQMTDAERARAQAQLEADTKARFEQLQREAANPKK